MSSLLTNTSSMTALATLRSINQGLETSNNRISTGERVSTASDNAAYWSIATTMKSDNQAMSSVKDSLSMGKSSLDATYTGLNAAKDVLNEIKAKLTTATNDGVSKSQVQSDITALQKQLRTIADSASFSGQNWLSTGSSTAFAKEIVSSLSRDTAGALTVGSIDVNITNIRLYGDIASGGSQSGILDKTIDLTKYSATGGFNATVQNDPIVDPDNGPVDFANADDRVSFSISQNGSPARTVEITQNTLTAAGLSDTKIRSNADLQQVLTEALRQADLQGVEVAVSNTGAVSFKSNDTFTVSGATATGIGSDMAAANADLTDTLDKAALDVTKLGLRTTAYTTVSASAGAASVAAIDISTASVSDIKIYLRVVDKALSEVTTAASSVGSIQTRVKMQSDFVSKLQDTIEQGVGSLIDADMEEESTRLKALQTQQQLGVQALSIANSSSQNILALFR